MSRNPAKSDGYVTLAVLLMVGLLAAIASSLLVVSRPALGLVRIGGDAVAAEALIEGGVTTAAFLLIGVERELSKVDNLRLRLRTGTIEIAATDEAARVDLNAADQDLLAGLFSAAGGTSMSADAFAARVIDWRDQDEDEGVNGAEAGSYAEAELGYGPPNMPFQSVDELRFLLRLSARDFERVRPLVTVFTGQKKIDPLSASEMVLRAIPGVGRRELQRIQQAKRTHRDRSRLLQQLAPEVAEHLLDESSGVYRVRVEARLPNGFSDGAEAVIIAPPEEDSADYRVVAWSKLAVEARQD
jgi:general secretion pathway protein K